MYYPAKWVVIFRDRPTRDNVNLSPQKFSTLLRDQPTPPNIRPRFTSPTNRARAFSTALLPFKKFLGFNFVGGITGAQSARNPYCRFLRIRFLLGPIKKCLLINRSRSSLNVGRRCDNTVSPQTVLNLTINLLMKRMENIINYPLGCFVPNTFDLIKSR